eukprot:Pgem_evm1s10720
MDETSSFIPENFTQSTKSTHTQSTQSTQSTPSTPSTQSTGQPGHVASNFLIWIPIILLIVAIIYLFVSSYYKFDDLKNEIKNIETQNMKDLGE